MAFSPQHPPTSVPGFPNGNSDSNNDRVQFKLALIMLLGLALRVRGLDWGLPCELTPFGLHPDEATNVSAPLGMLDRSSLNPKFFSYGSLYSYLVLGMLWLGDTFALLDGGVGEAIFLGRLVTIGCGLLTLPLVYSIGRMIFGQRVGLIASALMAVAPGLVMHGAFATVDVPSTLFVTLCLWGAIGYSNTGKLTSLMIGGVGCGLAAATKYPAGMVGLSLLAAIALTRESKGNAEHRTRKYVPASCAIVASAFGFFLTCPYALLDFPTFWAQASSEMFRHSFQGHGPVFLGTGNGWWYALTTNLPYALGPVLLLVSLFGLPWGLNKRPRSFLILLAFAIPYFILLGLIELRFMRYVLPLTPTLLVAGAGVLGSAWEKSSLHKSGVLIALILIAIPTAFQVSGIQQPDSRVSGLLYGDANIEAGDTVAQIYPSLFCAIPFSSSELFGARQNTEGPRVQIISLKGYSASLLIKSKARWLAVGEFWWSFEDPTTEVAEQEFWEAVENNYELVFSSSGGFPLSARHVFSPSSPPHDWVYPFMEQRIYRRVAQ